MDNNLYSTGITVHYGRGGSRGGVDFYGWWAELEWRQLLLETGGGACSGWITIQHANESLTQAIDILMAMAVRFGVQPLPVLPGRPTTHILAYDGGENNEDYPPPLGWRETLLEEANRRGWLIYEM